MKHLNYISAFWALLFLVSINACKDPVTPPNPNEEELITKVQLQFTEAGNPTNTFAAIYSDPDGDGGNAAVRFDTIRLDSGKVYDVAISLLDESDAGNVKNITDEVQEEAADHLFCFTPTGVNVQVVRTDSDGVYELGLLSRWTPTQIGSGTIRVELKHQPGIKNGTCTIGATDLQLDFVLQVN